MVSAIRDQWSKAGRETDVVRDSFLEEVTLPDEFGRMEELQIGRAHV